MYVIDFNGNEEMVLDFLQDSVEISRDLQGKYELYFSIVKTDKNKAAYDMIQDLVSIIVEDEVFTVRLIDENPYSKTVTCTHEFFDASDIVVDAELDEANRTIQQCVALLSGSGSGWTFSVTGSFNTAYLKFGNDNVIALLNTIMSEFEAEYTVSSTDKTVRISPKIGIETDYQVRYGHNLVAISKSIDANNVKTHIKIKYNPGDDGDFRSTATYISPHASNYPRPRWAKTVENNTTSNAVALAYGASQIVDTPSISIQVEFIELQKNGYNGNEINLGNSFYLIDDRMSEEDLARIVEMTTYPYSNRSPIVTLANRVKYYTDISIIQQQKQQLIDDEAVKKGENLDGVILTEENGLEVRAENNKQVKIWINASEGFTIVNGLVRKFYVDTMGNVNFDGRLNITNGNGVTQMLEAYMDSRGGRLKIFDNTGWLNVSMGSEIAGNGFNGGIVQVFRDGDSSNAMAELSAKASNQFSQPQGRLILKNQSLTNTVDIQANQGILMTDSSGREGIYTPTFAMVNNQILATQDWVIDYVSSVMPEPNPGP